MISRRWKLRWRLALAALFAAAGWLGGVAGTRSRDIAGERNGLALGSFNMWLEDAAKKAGRWPRDWNDALAILGLDPVYERRQQDFWDRPMVYRVDGEGWSAVSLGRDGVPGGDGWDADTEYRKIGETVVQVRRGEPPTWRQVMREPFGKGMGASGIGMMIAAIVGAFMGWRFGAEVVANSDSQAKGAEMLVAVMIVTPFVVALIAGFGWFLSVILAKNM